MPTITIDQRALTVADDVTILTAARQAGIPIPTLCHLEGCSPSTSCMVCVVKVQGQRHLLPACATVVRDGMVIESESDEVRSARRTALELLLSDHLGDCRGPCQAACPAHADLPAICRAINAGQSAEAIILLTARIPLPGVMGYICPAPCEKGCRRAQWDSAVALRDLERLVGEARLAAPAPLNLPALTGKCVAIAGAGPAGLSAAYYLRHLGIAATLFDSHDAPGGMLRTIFSEEQLPRRVLDGEIAAILATGVAFYPRMHVGREVTLETLRTDYDAVLLATGQHRADDVPVLEGNDHGNGITVDRETLMTGMRGVFAVGSAVAPVRQAIRAIAEGRVAARAIAVYLLGLKLFPHDRPLSVSHIGRLTSAELAQLLELANPAARSIPGASDTATSEAARCLHCDCRKLAECRLLAASLTFSASQQAFRGRSPRRVFTWDVSHADAIYEPGKCIACGLCIQLAERYRDALGLTFIGRGFTVRVAVPDEAPLAAALREATQACVDACPTGALAYRKSR